MSMKCPFCGTELDEEALFCDECGKRLPTFNNMNEMTEMNPDIVQVNNRQLSNSGMGIASIVFGIISLITCGCFLLPEILGIVFGFIDVSNKKSKNTFSIWGIVLSIISIVIMVMVIVVEL